MTSSSSIGGEIRLKPRQRQAQGEALAVARHSFGSLVTRVLFFQSSRGHLFNKSIDQPLTTTNHYFTYFNTTSSDHPYPHHRNYPHSNKQTQIQAHNVLPPTPNPSHHDPQIVLPIDLDLGRPGDA
jgi:hypothetical protein